jgi:hypothetical protein
MKKKVRIYKMQTGGSSQNETPAIRKKDFRYDSDAQAMYEAMLERGQYLLPDEDIYDAFSKDSNKKWQSRVLDQNNIPVPGVKGSSKGSQVYGLQVYPMGPFKNYKASPERVSANRINTAAVKGSDLPDQWHQDVAPGLRYTFTAEGVPHLYSTSPEGEKLLNYANKELGNYLTGFKGQRAGVLYDVPADIHANWLLQKNKPTAGPIDPNHAYPNTMQSVPMPNNFELPYVEVDENKFKTGGNWIQDVKKSMEQRGSVGRCTGTNFGGPDCPKGSPQYNLAVTFRQMAEKNKKKVYGGSTADQNVNIDNLTNTVKNNFLGHLTTNTQNVKAEDQYINQAEEQMLQQAQNFMQFGGNNREFGYVGNPMLNQQISKDAMLRNNSMNLMNDFMGNINQLAQEPLWQKELMAKTTFLNNEAGRQAKQEYGQINKDYNKHMKQMSKSPMYKYMYEQDLMNLNQPQMVYGGIPKYQGNNQSEVNSDDDFNSQLQYIKEVYTDNKVKWPAEFRKAYNERKDKAINDLYNYKQKQLSTLNNNLDLAEKNRNYVEARKIREEIAKINQIRDYKNVGKYPNPYQPGGSDSYFSDDELFNDYNKYVNKPISSNKPTSKTDDFRFYENPGVGQNPTVQNQNVDAATQAEQAKKQQSGTAQTQQQKKEEEKIVGNTKPDFGTDSQPKGNVTYDDPSKNRYPGGVQTNVGVLYPQYKPSMFGPRYTAPLLYNPDDITQTHTEYRRPLFRPGKQGAAKSMTLYHGVPGQNQGYNNQMPPQTNNVYNSINQVPMNTIRKVLDTANMSDEQLAELEAQNEKQRQYEQYKDQEQMFFNEMDRFDRSQMRYGGIRKYQGTDQSEVPEDSPVLIGNQNVSGFPDPSTLSPEQLQAYYDLAKSMQRTNYGFVPGAIRTADTVRRSVQDFFTPKSKKVSRATFAYGGMPEYNVGGWPSGSANIAPDENWGKTKLYEGVDPQKKAQIAKMAFDAGTAGLTMLGNAITEPRSNYSEMTSADRVFTTDPLMQRGTDGTLGNYQGLASDQSMVSMGAKNTGRTAGINRYGGVPEYQEGGTYDLTEEEIAQIMRMGGKVEFL